MSSNPLVSVVIPFFNAERFIQEAIESVFAQTYDNWELLLVDDGSTDRSTAIALRCARQHPKKVRYLEHERHQNRGACATRNVGFTWAKAEYIAFLDADDVWLPNKLAEQVPILNSHPNAAMVYGYSLRWYSWTSSAEDRESDNMLRYGLPTNALINPPQFVVEFLKGETPTPSPSNLLLRRELLERIGGFEESFTGIYQAHEDQAFLIKAHLEHSVYVSSQCWDKYRKHRESCIAVVRAAGMVDVSRLYFLNWLEKYLAEKGFRNTEVWQLVQKELWPFRHPILFWIRHGVSEVGGVLRKVSGRTLPTPVRAGLRTLIEHLRQSVHKTNKVRFEK
jgi:glycosyltransferase involved in cell wall biosynthesis